MQDPNQSPFSSSPSQRDTWQNAPVVVRGWAYSLTWLGMVFSLLLLIILGLTYLGRSVAIQEGRPVTGSNATGAGFVLISIALFVVHLWLNRGLKRGVTAAWVTQIILSGFVILTSLLNVISPNVNLVVPLISIAVHAYILSQWFDLETKAWFGKT